MVNELSALNKDLNPKDSQRFLSLFSRQGIAVSRPSGRLSSFSGASVAPAVRVGVPCASLGGRLAQLVRALP